jgi:hypothetical protein
MPKTIPQNGQANWGTALNSHIGQLMDPTYGGFNIVADNIARDAKYTGLGANDAGLTVFNRKINEFQVWTTTPFGNSWMDLNGDTAYETQPGVGVLNRRTDGLYEILVNGSAIDISSIGLGIGSVVTSGAYGMVVRYVTADKKKFYGDKNLKNNSRFSNYVDLNTEVSIQVGQPVVYAGNGTNFGTNGLNVQVGDWFGGILPSAVSALSGRVIAVSNNQLTLEPLNGNGATINLTASTWRFHRLSGDQNLSYTYTKVFLSINNSLFLASNGNVETTGTLSSEAGLIVISDNESSGVATGYFYALHNSGTDRINNYALVARSLVGSGNVTNSVYGINTLVGNAALAGSQSSNVYVERAIGIRSTSVCEFGNIKEMYGIWSDLSSVGTSGGTIDRYYPFYESRSSNADVSKIGKMFNFFQTKMVLGGSTSTIPQTQLSVRGLPVYADNAAATTAGLLAGDFYRKADGTVMVRF